MGKENTFGLMVMCKMVYGKMDNLQKDRYWNKMVKLYINIKEVY